jgi:hypothetical protein
LSGGIRDAFASVGASKILLQVTTTARASYSSKAKGRQE